MCAFVSVCVCAYVCDYLPILHLRAEECLVFVKTLSLQFRALSRGDIDIGIISLTTNASAGAVSFSSTARCTLASSVLSVPGSCSHRWLGPTKDHGVSVSELLCVMAGSNSFARVQRRSTSKSMITQYRVVTSTFNPSMYPWRSL